MEKFKQLSDRAKTKIKTLTEEEVFSRTIVRRISLLIVVRVLKKYKDLSSIGRKLEGKDQEGKHWRG